MAVKGKAPKVGTKGGGMTTRQSVARKTEESLIGKSKAHASDLIRGVVRAPELLYRRI